MSQLKRTDVLCPNFLLDQYSTNGTIQFWQDLIYIYFSCQLISLHTYAGLAFPPLYFYSGGVREFLATLKQHIFIMRLALIGFFPILHCYYYWLPNINMMMTATIVVMPAHQYEIIYGTHLKICNVELGFYNMCFYFEATHFHNEVGPYCLFYYSSLLLFLVAKHQHDDDINNCSDACSSI